MTKLEMVPRLRASRYGEAGFSGRYGGQTPQGRTVIQAVRTEAD